MKISWFKIFFYISLAFLAIALYSNDYLNIPAINNLGFLIISFTFLFAGFIFNGLSWTRVIKQADYPVTIKSGIVSVGLSIFGKYIPGKLWVILGRAEFLTKKYGYSRKSMSALSLNTQFISLWVGLLLGTIGLLLISKLDIYGLSALGLFALLTLIIYTPLFHRLFEYLVLKVIKRTINIPRLNFKNVLQVLPWFILNWGFWIVSFYFLGESLTAEPVTFNIAWGFALAGSLGIMAIIAPGGLGVREGLLTGYLTLAGLELADATTIAVASRLWFLVGEVFIFGIAMILNQINIKNG